MGSTVSEKNSVSKQNLRDNAIRFRREIENRGRKKTNKNNEDSNRRSSDGNIEWTTEMKVNLLEIDKRERRRRRGFMNRMKDTWDVIYERTMFKR